MVPVSCDIPDRATASDVAVLEMSIPGSIQLATQRAAALTMTRRMNEPMPPCFHMVRAAACGAGPDFGLPPDASRVPPAAAK